MKFKKQILAVGSLAAVVAPIASVVACGETTTNLKKVGTPITLSDKAPAKVDQKVVIKTTWASTGAQINALKATVAAYNAQKDDADYKVEVQHVEGGYGTAFANDKKDILINHMSTVADAYIDYPDTAGGLSNIKGKDYSLNLADISKVDLNQFDQRFINKDSKTLPLALSTEMDSIDLPVLGKILTEIGDKDTLAIKDGVIGSALKAWDGGKASDASTINNLWKLKDGSKKVSINNDTFMDYPKLFDFANKAQAAYGFNAESDIHIVGEDAPTNLAYILYASKNGIDNKDIYSATENTFLHDGAKFKETLKSIHDVVATGGLILNGGGAYSSEDLTKHRMVFAIGSTAGYNHNFIADGKESMELHISDKDILKLGSYDKSLKLKEDGKLVTDDVHGNPVLTEGTKAYSIVTKAGDLTKVTALSEGHKFYLAEKVTDDQKAIIDADETMAVVDASSYDAKGEPHPTHLIAIPEDKVVLKSLDSSDLNRNEIDFIPAPNTNGTDNKFAYAQGPSFVGVTHGNKKDSELGKFISWFYNPNSRLEGDTTTSDVSVMDSFGKAASYIIPKEGFVNEKWDENKFGANYMTTQVFKDLNVNAYSNIVSVDSKGIREQIETSLMKTLGDAYHQGKTQAVDALYSSIKKDLGYDRIK